MLRGLKKGWLAGCPAAMYKAAGGGGGGSTTWNPADKNSNITLSGGNLIATAAAISDFQSLRSVSSRSSGKYYWEVTIGTVATSTGIVLGISNGTQSLASGSYVSNSANSLGWTQGTTQFKSNNAFVASTGAVTYGTGDIVSLALDVGNGKLWSRVNGGQWMGTTDDPATNTGGASVSVTGPFFAAGTLFEPSGTLTANFGGSAFAYTPPSGFGNL